MRCNDETAVLNRRIKYQATIVSNFRISKGTLIGPYIGEYRDCDVASVEGHNLSNNEGDNSSFLRHYDNDGNAMDLSDDRGRVEDTLGHQSLGEKSWEIFDLEGIKVTRLQ